MDFIAGKLVENVRKMLHSDDKLVLAPTNSGSPIVGIPFMIIGLAVAGFGITVLTGATTGQGNIAVPVLVGLAFALIGYAITFQRDLRQFDLATRQWRSERGVAPFLKIREGYLSDWSFVQFLREERTRSSAHGGTSSYTVWSVQLRAEEDRIAPLPLTELDLPAAYVGRTDAVELARLLAQKLTLPLRELDGEEAASPVGMTLPDCSAVAATTLDPPSPRLRTARLEDGTLLITLRGNLRAALPALIPVVAVTAFIAIAEKSHRDFLDHVPKSSRAFFSSSPSPILFFSPFLLIVLVASGASAMFQLAQRHVQIGRTEISVFNSLFGRPYGKRSILRRGIREIQSVARAASSGKSGALASKGTLRSLVIVSDQPDLSVAAGLSEAEAAWLQAALRAETGLSV